LGSGVVFLALAGGFAAGAVWYPALAIAVAAAIPLVMVARCFPRVVENLFLRLLLTVLVGYALLGRTFAGLGARPVYIGEIVLGLGMLSAVATGWHLRRMRTPSVYLLLTFMCWGAVRTVPYIETYGLNALRDAVVWGYGVFALLLAPVLVGRALVDHIPALYGRLLPWLIICAPLWVIVAEWTGLGGMAETTLKLPKPGDAAVHLGGAAAFLLLGVRARRLSAPGGWFAEWGALAALLVIGVVAMGSLNRGGLLAFIAATLVVMILAPLRVGGKLLLAASAVLLVGTIWLGWGASFQVRPDRAVSPEQIADNLRSIGGSETGNLAGTRRWRLLWWNSIIDYTVHGEYFWSGKGFGLNVAYDDGYQPYPESPTRSPHNGHLTILARAGVPGLVLWGALQLGFGLTMLAALFRARQANQHHRESLFVWILAYWAAFLVNASFDVALEGPHAGIWFWCIFAYGIALVTTQRRQLPLRALVQVPSTTRRPRTLAPSGGA
jgi:hypothetical protein